MIKEFKEGYKTTEFYLTLIGNVVAIALILGLIGQDQADVVLSSADSAAGAIVEIVQTISGPLLLAISNGAYAIARGKAKGG